MNISPKSKAALIRVVANNGHSDISLLAIELGLDGEAVGSNRLERSMALVRAMEARGPAEESGAFLLDLAESQLTSANEWQLESDDCIRALIRSLEVDGYAFQNGRLLPATPAPTALQEAISLLETDMEMLGLDVSLNHYQQAVENYVSGNWEAANAQVRSFLENLFVSLCVLHSEKTFADPGAALQHLYNTEWLDKGEYNHYRHFWDDIQDNGPHHGLSTDQEALFRLHYATSVARYLVAKGG